MKKRIFSLILVISMFLTMIFPITVTAAETADYTWYNTTAKSFTLSDVGDLIGFANIVSGTADSIAQDSFATKTVTLGANVDLAGVNWTPIGGFDGANAFEGIFDGANNTISNLKCTADSSATRYMGLFAKLSGATVKDLTLDKVTLSISKNDTLKASYVATLAGYAADVTISGITINNLNISCSTLAYVGGLLGYMNNTTASTISDCRINGFTSEFITDATMSSNNLYHGVGGAVSYHKGEKLSISNFSLTNLDITFEWNKGGGSKKLSFSGIVGTYVGQLEVSSSSVAGAINSTQECTSLNTGNVGSFIGTAYSTAGTGNTAVFTSCTSTINITSYTAVGGFIGMGYINNAATFRQCSYDGTLIGRNVGSIIGQAQLKETVALDRCEIVANIGYYNVNDTYVTSYADALIGHASSFTVAPSLAIYNSNISITIDNEIPETKFTDGLFSAYKSYICYSEGAGRDINGNVLDKDSFNVAEKDGKKGNFAQTKYDATNGLDIRLVTAVDEATVTAGDKLGFITFLTYKDALGNTIVKCVSGETDTVYTSVKADGLDKSAADLGGDYIYVAEIEGYKSATCTDGATDITLNVIPYLVNDTTVAYDTMATYNFDFNGDIVA